MAIQFPCPSCRQPIEVDDEHAGQTAACPYCQRVVSVPSESAGQIRPAAVARPAPGEGEPAGPVELHLGAAPSPRQRSAVSYGNYALICTGLALALFVVALAYSFVLVARTVSFGPEAQPSPEQIVKLQQEIATKHPLVPAAFLGATFFAVVGLALAVVSVRQSAQGNWRGLTSLIVCGFFVLCFCGGNLVSMLGIGRS